MSWWNKLFGRKADSSPTNRTSPTLTYSQEVSSDQSIPELSEMVVNYFCDQSLSLVDIVLSYRDLFPKDGFFFYDQIPSDILEKAKLSYGKSIGSQEEILFLYNQGDKGKSGFIITDNSIFSCRQGHGFYMKWSLLTIKKIWIFSYRDQYNITINDARLYGGPRPYNKQRIEQINNLCSMIIGVVSKVSRPNLMHRLIITSNSDNLNFNISESYYIVPIA